MNKSLKAALVITNSKTFVGSKLLVATVKGLKSLLQLYGHKLQTSDLNYHVTVSNSHLKQITEINAHFDNFLLQDPPALFLFGCRRFHQCHE